VGRIGSSARVATLSADGSTAAIGGPSGIEVLATEDGTRVSPQILSSVDALALNGDGSTVAGAAGQRIVVAPHVDCNRVDAIDVGESVTAVGLSRDGSSLAVGTASGGVRVLTAEGAQVAEFKSAGHAISSVALSADGDQIAAGFADGTLALWDVEAHRRLYERRQHRQGTEVTSVSFSSQDDRLVSAGSDATLRVWDASTGESFPLRGHSRTVADGAFSPNGQWIVSAGRGVVGLFDLASRQRLVFLRGHEGQVLSASFDASGRRIVTVGADGTLRAYSCGICAGVPGLLRLAEQRLAATGRELTPAERARYFDGSP
jgi:WD40 repeat protein